MAQQTLGVVVTLAIFVLILSTIIHLSMLQTKHSISLQRIK